MQIIHIRDFDEAVGKKIKLERLLNDYMKQSALASDLGISQDALSRIERGKRPTRFSEIVAIAITLKIPLEEFAPEDLRVLLKQNPTGL